MSLSVKLFFGDEIRRFPLGPKPTIDWLLSKVHSLYENLQGKRVKIFWKDAEGDKITITGSEDLIEALMNRTDDLLRLYLTVDETPQQDVHMGEVDSETKRLTLEELEMPSPPKEEPKPEEKPDPDVHQGVICDGCDSQIKGRRFKCVVCPDYDLCGDCETKNLHAEHPMLRLTNAADKTSRKLFSMLHRFTMGCGAGHVPHARGEHYLSSVGDILTCALKSFGIDVDYEVRPPKTQTDQQGKQQNCQPQAASTPKTEEEPKKVEIMEQEKSSTPTEPAVTEATPQDWEMVDKNAAGNQPTDQAAQSSNNSARLYPETGAATADLESRVSESLTYMLAMGFNNDGDWLKQLLYRKNADIPAVLDILQPKF